MLLTSHGESSERAWKQWRTENTIKEEQRSQKPKTSTFSSWYYFYISIVILSSLEAYFSLFSFSICELFRFNRNKFIENKKPIYHWSLKNYYCLKNRKKDNAFKVNDEMILWLFQFSQLLFLVICWTRRSSIESSRAWSERWSRKKNELWNRNRIEQEHHTSIVRSSLDLSDWQLINEAEGWGSLLWVLVGWLILCERTWSQHHHSFTF